MSQAATHERFALSNHSEPFPSDHLLSTEKQVDTTTLELTLRNDMQQATVPHRTTNIL